MRRQTNICTGVDWQLWRHMASANEPDAVHQHQVPREVKTFHMSSLLKHQGIGSYSAEYAPLRFCCLRINQQDFIIGFQSCKPAANLSIWYSILREIDHAAIMFFSCPPRIICQLRSALSTTNSSNNIWETFKIKGILLVAFMFLY